MSDQGQEAPEFEIVKREVSRANGWQYTEYRRQDGSIFHTGVPSRFNPKTCVTDWDQDLEANMRDTLGRDKNRAVNKLPGGKTCGECASWLRCEALICTLEPTNTRCDWSPSRFRPKDSAGTLARIAELTRQLKASQERCRAAERIAEGADDAHKARKEAARDHAEVCELHRQKGSITVTAKPERGEARDITSEVLSGEPITFTDAEGPVSIVVRGD